jgi:hypothetical protein
LRNVASTYHETEGRRHAILAGVLRIPTHGFAGSGPRDAAWDRGARMAAEVARRAPDATRHAACLERFFP